MTVETFNYVPIIPDVADAPDAPVAPAAPWIEGPADTIVPDLLDESRALAEETMDRAVDAFSRLSEFAPVVNTIVVPSIPVNSLTSVSVPGETPVEPDISTPFPIAPAAPETGELDDLVLDAPPVYDVTAPALIDIDLPDPLSAVVPSEPTLDVVEMPVESSFVLPDVPTLASFNLPDTPTIDIPIFSETLGVSPDAPSAEFAWAEAEYQTDLLASLKSNLLTFVDGASTGLDPDVEAAIWNRGRDREAILVNKAVDEAKSLMASRGFTMPDGTILVIVQQAVQDSIARDAELSREIMVKQAELEQSNRQFAFTASVQLENSLMSHFNNVQERAFKAQTFTFDAAIKIFDARVRLFQADVQAFGMKAQVFETRLKSALSQLEVYKAQLEGQRTLATINQQQVAVYVAQLEGVKAVVDVYRTRVEAAKVKVETNSAVVELYRAKLQGFESIVRSKGLEYEAYSTQVKAEVSKTEIFSQQVGAYKSRVDAWNSLVQGKIGVQTLEFKRLQEYPVEIYKSRIQAYQAEVSAVAEELKARGIVFDSKVKAYVAREQARGTFEGTDAERQKVIVQAFSSRAQLELQASEASLRVAAMNAETAQGSLRSAAQVAGSLASAALASRSVNASITSSVQNSSGNSSSNSSSNSSGNTTSRNVGANTSIGVSTSNATNHNYEHDV